MTTPDNIPQWAKAPHSAEDDFQHYLSYSNIRDEGPASIELRRHAFYAAWSPAPTPQPISPTEPTVNPLTEQSDGTPQGNSGEAVSVGDSPAGGAATVKRLTLSGWLSIYGRKCYTDFVKESDFSQLERELNAAKAEVERLREGWGRALVASDAHERMCVRIWEALGVTDRDYVHEKPCDVMLIERFHELADCVGRTYDELHRAIEFADSNDLDMTDEVDCGLNILIQQLTILRTELTNLRAENAKLRAWKKSALAVEREWDDQAVGKLLGIPLGHSIRANIQVKVQELLGEVAELRKDKEQLIRDAVVAGIKPLLPNNSGLPHSGIVATHLLIARCSPETMTLVLEALELAKAGLVWPAQFNNDMGSEATSGLEAVRKALAALNGEERT